MQLPLLHGSYDRLLGQHLDPFFGKRRALISDAQAKKLFQKPIKSSSLPTDNLRGQKSGVLLHGTLTGSRSLCEGYEGGNTMLRERFGGEHRETK